MPDHHLPEELLLAYAAGVASEPHALLCAVHLTLCEACRADLALYEEIGGALLDASPATDGSASVEQGTPPAAISEDGALPDGAELWPRALHPYVRGRRWHWHSPGVHMLSTELILAEMPVRLFRLAPGHHVPMHTHQGVELTLVLSGGFVDLGEHFQRGDIACRDDEIIHDLVIDDGECVTLTINEHPLVPLTLAGKLYSVLRKP